MRKDACLSNLLSSLDLRNISLFILFSSCSPELMVLLRQLFLLITFWWNSHNLGNQPGRCMALASIPVSQGHCYKAPHTGQFKTTEMYSLTVLEARSLKSRCWLVRASCKGSREQSFLVSPHFQWSLGILGFPCLQQHSSIPASIFTWLSSPCMCLWVPKSLFIRIPVIGCRAHPNPV